ncbi:MAG: alkyl hydroperoxide reductase subunit F [Spirochaetota bacterium]
MLDANLKAQIKEHMQRLKKKITFEIDDRGHEKHQELLQMLQDIADTSQLITVEKVTNKLRSGVTFQILQEENPVGITFSGIPGGHEFSSLILATLQAGGVPLKLDESLQSLIKNFQGEMKFETIVSLDCHNCPEVVQALNQMALLNPGISHEMIDGGLFQEIVTERNVQGVPSVFLNGETFSNGKIEISDIIEKIQQDIPEASVSKEDVIQEDHTVDVAIIGGGPAGVSAAIYSARKGLDVMVIADRIGGQVKDTMGIENMISIPKTTGPELSNSMEQHLSDYKVTIRKNLKVKDIQTDQQRKILELNTGERVLAKTVIIATGAKWRQLGIPGEKENIGNGVAYCPHCDGPFFKDKDVIVVGGGNSGVEAALDLSGIVKSVKILEFMPEAKADQILLDKANATKNISMLTNVASQEITSKDGKVQGIQYKDRESGTESFIEAEGVFIQIGLVPNSDFVGDTLNLTKYGEIIVNDKCETNIPGVYACGDVTTVPYKQIVISMGEGAKAALSSYEYILMNFDEEEKAA